MMIILMIMMMMMGEDHAGNCFFYVGLILFVELALNISNGVCMLISLMAFQPYPIRGHVPRAQHTHPYIYSINIHRNHNERRSDAR